MLHPGGERFVFGEFELRSASGELLRAGLILKLPPQPFRLLVILVSRPGELITREEIQDALWSDGTTVEFDQSLNFCIRQIRTALADDAREPKYIETLPKRGYRFIAPVTHVAQPDNEGKALKPAPQPAPLAALPYATRWRPLAWLASGVIAMAASLFLVFHRTAVPQPIPGAILVRPFVNLGLPAEDAWFSDALTQQIIGALAETKSAHVVPWSSTLALKNQSAGVRELGNRFHVDAILEGSVSRSGERLRVVTQLVDAGTERILWSHQDERDARDLARVQDDVMGAIASTLKLRLTEAAIPEARRRPQDQETYNLYLKALVFGDQFSASGATESVKDFEEVSRRAPNYAPAYAGLANELAIMPFFQTGKTQEVLARSREAAERALALDPGSALAHAARGHSLFNSWNWNEAEKELQTAIGLDPDSATAHDLYGLLLGTQNRSEEAIREARRAVDLAPTSAIISYGLTADLLHAGQFDESIAQGRRTLELDRGFALAYHDIIRSYTLKGMPAEANQALNELERIEPDTTMQPLLRANQLATTGKRAEALKMIDQWIASSPRASRPPMDLVVALLSAGEKDRAFKTLHRAVELHVPSMVWLKSTPELAGVRSDPRFADAVGLMDSE